MHLEQYDSIKEITMKASVASDVYAITRLQDATSIRINVVDGKVDGIHRNSKRGTGVQVFTKDGLSGFSSADRIDPGEVERLIGSAAELAKKSPVAGGHTNTEVFNLQKHEVRRPAQIDYNLNKLDLRTLENALIEINNETRALGSELSVSTGLFIGYEEWRIFRSDGTDVHFAIPRCIIRNGISARTEGRASSTMANISGVDPRVLISDEYRQLLRRRSETAANIAMNLTKATPIKAGHYKLVIDYSLAMVLAHEAFGHAAEVDRAESTILAKNGKFRTGEVVAAPIVSIVDGPILGDNGDQPFSVNGVPRDTVTIVENGVLKDGLADVFSAREAGVRNTGAARAQSYEHLPIPRMSNIRLTVNNAYPINQDFEDITPSQLRTLLEEAGLLKEDEQILYLSGAMGGQVNPATGDFVFTCSGVYELREEAIPRQATSFSGQILSALKAISGGLGSVNSNAAGTCGKSGQMVSCGGGSNLFIVIEKDQKITIGGGQ
ncbi:MAG: TldD/PmbA family protein [Limnochordia bacterium]|nr:TldD/PmbA family protein [Limnochordia bacterium]